MEDLLSYIQLESYLCALSAECRFWVCEMRCRTGLELLRLLLGPFCMSCARSGTLKVACTNLWTRFRIRSAESLYPAIAQSANSARGLWAYTNWVRLKLLMSRLHALFHCLCSWHVHAILLAAIIAGNVFAQGASESMSSSEDPHWGKLEGEFFCLLKWKLDSDLLPWYAYNYQGRLPWFFFDF